MRESERSGSETEDWFRSADLLRILTGLDRDTAHEVLQSLNPGEEKRILAVTCIEGRAVPCNIQVCVSFPKLPRSYTEGADYYTIKWERT
jgi:hypothetical protein